MVHKGDCTLECNGALGADRHKGGSPSKGWRMHYDVVIVGGGAGGLELAAQLGRKLGAREGRERVLLVDRMPFHIWKPTLHEVAAGTLDAHQEGLSYTVLARRNHFSFAMGEFRELDAAAQSIRLAAIVNDAGKPVVPEE